MLKELSDLTFPENILARLFDIIFISENSCFLLHLAGFGGTGWKSLSLVSRSGVSLLLQEAFVDPYKPALYMTGSCDLAFPIGSGAIF